MSADMTAEDFAGFRGAAVRRQLEAVAFQRVPLRLRGRAAYVKATKHALARKGYDITPLSLPGA